MRKKKWIKVSIICMIIFIYLIRVIYVNRDNYKCDIKYISSSEVFEYNDIEYNVLDETIYEMPAFVEKYPQIEKYYTYASNIYTVSGNEDALRNLKYVIGVKVQLKNKASAKRKIYLGAYQIYGKAFSNEVNPYLFRDLNNCREEFEIPANGQRTIVLSYDTHAETIKNLSYEKLMKENLSVSISGYPNIMRVILNNLKLVKSSGRFNPYEVKEEKIIDDTKENTVLGLGEILVDKGIGISTLSVSLVDNAKDYEEYDQNFLLDYCKEFVQDDGRIKSIDESCNELPKVCRKYGYKTYMIFVKLKIHNYNSYEASMNNSYELFDYKRTLSGKDIMYFESDNSISDKNLLMGSIAPSEDKFVTIGYIKSIPLNTDAEKLDLYISNAGSPPNGKINLRKGICGGQKYLRIK